MLKEDSIKLEKEKAETMQKEELAAFMKRKKRLKDDTGIDLDAKPKKQAGRPKGARNKKGAK